MTTAYTPRTLWAHVTTWYAMMSTYRAEIFLWALATSLPLIMMGVWVEAGGSGKFGAFGAVEAARYFIAVFVVRQFTVVWVIHEFEWNVVSGRLSPKLLLPIDPAVGYVVMHWGEQLTRWPFALGLIGLAFWLQPEALTGGADGGWWVPTWWQVGLCVLASGLAFLLRFVMQYCVSLLAFWLERVMALDGLVMLPYTFLSGLVVPLEVMPDVVREAVLWTPFPYMVWFPATLLSGEVSGGALLDGEVSLVRGFVTVLAWLAGLWCVNRWMWRRGLKHYSAMGA